MNKILVGGSFASILGSILLAIAGCGTFGSNPSPPTALEQKLFSVQTNYVPVVIGVTNYATNTITVPVVQTVTNVQGITVTQTNWQTNVISVPMPSTQTNLQPQYSYGPGAGIQTAQTVAGTAGALFGVGGLATTAIGVLASLWGWLRSSKNYATAANTAQVVETMREFVKQLPNGTAYDQALTSFMQQHQAENGVLQNILQVLENDVSNPDAKVAAASVISSLQQLGINPAVAPTTPTKV